MKEMSHPTSEMENIKRRSKVAVAIDKDKGSQHALKWAIDHVLNPGEKITLIHVKQRFSTVPTTSGSKPAMDEAAKEFFRPFRTFCTRKKISCQEMLIEDTDIQKSIIECVNINFFETLVLGACTKGGLMRRLRCTSDVPTTVMKHAPEFTTVCVISKDKVVSMRSASRPVPAAASRIPQQPQRTSDASSYTDTYSYCSTPQGDNSGYRRSSVSSQSTDEDFMRSPFTRGKGTNGKWYGEVESNMVECDISFVSSRRPVVEPSSDWMFPRESFGWADSGLTSNFLHGCPSSRTSLDLITSSPPPPSFQSSTNGTDQCSTPPSVDYDDVETTMKRLQLELKQTMDMFNAACKEALTSKQEERELQMDEDEKLKEIYKAEEEALAIVEKEKQRCQAALEAAVAARKMAEVEAQRRRNAEIMAVREAEEKRKAISALTSSHGDVAMYRKYSIQEIEAATDNFSQTLKIGEGGYGPVYRCMLDHTPVAIKALRPDAAQGQSQFRQEVEILGRIRHPNMVILLGACPEYGCLVYEYMSNGSLEDRLFCHDNTPPLPWQLRFRIAAEIGTALLFLHQTKPKPLVHRDLKPANILLDDNFVSKISDVGLARLIPPSVFNTVTQYRMTQTAGTFCYIDPEYQQTGMLGVKSDVYSLGILFLQLVTAKPPMGLAHHVEMALETGNIERLLDPQVKDWPLEDTIRFVKMSLKCTELRRKDRPDLATEVLPELARLRALAC